MLNWRERAKRWAAAFGLASASAWTAAVSAQEPPPKTPIPTVQFEATTATDSELPYVGARALTAPNMFGDILGTRPLSIVGFGGSGGGSSRQLSGFIRDSVPSNASFQSATGSTLLKLLSSDMFFQGTKLPNSNFNSTVPVTGPPQKTLSILEVAGVTQAIQASLAKSGEVAAFNSASSNAQFNSRTENIYDIFLVYDFTSGTSTFLLPNPADGGLAGRSKVSTDSSPVPRDRFIFNYDFLNRTALMPAGASMNRIVFGFEKTFLDGWGSLEFRAPFASTISSTSREDGTFASGVAEFGNLFLNVKGLLYSDDNVVWSGGLGISVPTADDVRFRNSGRDAIVIQNDAVILTPYFAALFTPSDRLFMQKWLAFNFDASGNRVQTNLDGNGSKGIGKLYDPTAIQFDCQIGYWLLHPGETNRRLRGFAPFFEFHLNQQLQDQVAVSDGAFSLVNQFGRLTEINLSAGAVMQFYDNLHMTLGITAPVGNPDDRFSDISIGLRVNWFFGPTGRARVSLF